MNKKNWKSRLKFYFGNIVYSFLNLIDAIINLFCALLNILPISRLAYEWVITKAVKAEKDGKPM